MARIAVEASLSDVKQLLQERGHEVVNMEEASNCSCCVITGQDQNVMGMSNTSTRSSVVNADGKTAQEIVEQVMSCVQ